MLYSRIYASLGLNGYYMGECPRQQSLLFICNLHDLIGWRSILEYDVPLVCACPTFLLTYKTSYSNMLIHDELAMWMNPFHVMHDPKCPMTFARCIATFHQCMQTVYTGSMFKWNDHFIFIFQSVLNPQIDHTNILLSFMSKLYNMARKHISILVCYYH